MPDASGLHVEIAQDAPISLHVAFRARPREVLAIFGPSGSGKTTILRTIAGLYRPARANVRSGESIWTGGDTFIPPHRRAVGFVFQEYALFPHLTARDNVAAPLGHLPRGERRRRADAFLERVHLSGKSASRPAELSGGERQRVAVARALARDPEVLLLDEPFAAIDRAVRRRLQNEIDALRQTLDIPLILVTHDFEDVLRLATHLLILEHGRAVASGPLSDLMSRPDLPWLHDAVGLGSVFEARVGQRRAESGLVELAFDGGLLLAADSALAAGEMVRVRIPAREVILATSQPAGVSVHNALPGTVSALATDPLSDHVIVQLAVGKVLLLAEVTRDAVGRLGIGVGTQLTALIKSVSIWTN